VIRVLPAAERFETVQPGITTRHCFSAGPHYDPGNTSFGPLIGVDEHVVAPAAGFARHAHRGVDILSWVLEGALRHEDGSGRIETVRPGSAQLQVTGGGIEHSELNASATERLRFVQMTLLADADAGSARYLLGEPPVAASGGEFGVHRGGRLSVVAPLLHLFVAAGSYDLAGRPLGPGDSVRADEPLAVDGAGELLVWALSAA
jgi:quercetin 2,3-dioxygenase